MYRPTASVFLACLLLWQVVSAVEHALFVRVPRQEPLNIFGPEGYNIPLPSGPPLLEEQRDKRQAQEKTLPLQNVFRWFQDQFPNQKQRKAARDISETLGDPSRQYLPIPSQPSPRPFEPVPSRPSPQQPPQLPPQQPPQLPPQQPPQRPPTPFPSRPPPTFVPSTPRPFPSRPPPVFPSSPRPTHSDDDDAHLHPPHIHALDVTCAKDKMDIRIEFDREFYGTIYSKGYYTDAACRYVTPGTGQTVYQFTLYLDQCGTRFVDGFSTSEGRAFLEGTLVLQNEAGIQEVWDTVRQVQCLWEGNVRQQLKAGLSVDVLNEEVVTFSGDTASTQLDIRVGKFGEGGGASATGGGLVQIGTDMSLVVTIDGDPGFDVHVRECVAKPAGGVSEGYTGKSDKDLLRLTDERGCPLKTKIFGSFQKKRGGVGIGGQETTLYAYAHFQAFKFPDRMDVTIECDVELCKGGCDYCPDTDQNTVGFSQRRKRREANSTEAKLDGPIESVRMVQHLRVVTPEELSLLSGSGSTSLFFSEGQALEAEPGVCMSRWGFATASILLLSALTSACILSAVLYIRSCKNQPHLLKAQTLAYVPSSMQHR